MRVTTESVLSDAEVASFYPVYLRAWQPLLTRAAARHLLSEEEFRKEMGDPRIEKVLLRNDTDRPVALTTFTRDLSVVEWINPDYYRARYGEAVDRGALFYLGYTLVDRAGGGSQALVLMANEINRRVAAVQGVIGYDICSYNNLHGIGRYTTWLFGGSEAIDQLDTQTYYAADYRGTTQPVTDAVAPNEPEEPGPSQLDLVSLAARPDLVGDLQAVLSTRWPTVMSTGQHADVAGLMGLLLAAPEYQVLMLDQDDKVQGVGVSVPIYWDGTDEGLPGGCDDALVRSAQLVKDQTPPNAACSLSVTVTADAARQGVAELIITGLRDAAARAGAVALICPTRPILKSCFPIVEMSDYAGWRTGDGAHFDPWLRLHVRLGGRLLKVSEASTVLTGSVEEWRRWTGEELPGPGLFVIPGALAPLLVDGAVGTYVEACLWIVHELSIAAN